MSSVADNLTANLTEEELQELEELLSGDPGTEADAGSEYAEDFYETVHESFDSLPVTYLPETGYRYRFPDGNSVILSVPDGARTKDPVEVRKLSDFILINVYMNGKEIFHDGSEAFTEPGEYRLVLESVSADETKNVFTDYETELSFTIGTGYLTGEGGITAPEGMVVKSLRKDSFPVAIGKNLRTVPLMEDGQYTVEYEGEEDPSLTYREELIRDTVPPVLTFSEDISSGTLRAPVYISRTEEGVTVTVIKEGVELPLTEQGITSGGFYIVLAEDPAGNITEYELPVRSAKKISGTLWIFTAVVIILVAVLQMIKIRKYRSIR